MKESFCINDLKELKDLKDDEVSGSIEGQTENIRAETLINWMVETFKFTPGRKNYVADQDYIETKIELASIMPQTLPEL